MPQPRAGESQVRATRACLAAVKTIAIVLILAVAPVRLEAASATGSPSPRASTRALRTAFALEPLSSTGSSSAQATTASPDSFYLYGGPGRIEGRFETPGGIADWQGWSSVDLTEVPPRWQVSTYDADNLNDHGPGNHAMWAGNTAEQQPTWQCPPGYGFNWNELLVWSSGPLSDPSVGQTVDLDFFYNINAETGYDYFYVEYDSAGTWVTVFAETGTTLIPPFSADGVYPPPGVHYADTSHGSIVYDGNDYGGPNGDEIRVRMRATSDGAHSAADCIYIDQHGHTHVDDVTVVYSDGGQTVTDFEDFEGTAPYRWEYVRTAPMFGDFAKLRSGLVDIDPCRSNPSVQVVFVDDGTAPNNYDWPDPWPGAGTTSGTWSYGVPGGWVTPLVSSLDPTGSLGLNDEIRSPVIAWDLPGTEDDAAAGLTLGFDAWAHLPFSSTRGDLQLLTYGWRARFSTDGGQSWGDWEQTLAYVSQIGRYRSHREVLTSLVPPGVTHLQVALRAWDWCKFYFHEPCVDSTPSPWFDNVWVAKHGAGPAITAEEVDLFQDVFPISGSADASTDPEQLACRLDMSRNLFQLWGYRDVIPGDSVVVEVFPPPGHTLDHVEMHWILDVNPRFDAVRDLPPGTTVLSGTAPHGWDQWTGVIVGQPSTASGQPVPNRYWFDAPYEPACTWGPAYRNVPCRTADGPEAMFFAGDVLRYYVEAEDDAGRVTTLPFDLQGFDGSGGYDRRFTVRALPTIVDQGGQDVQPRVLLVQDGGRGANEDMVLHALRQNGLQAGVDFDLYAVQAPSMGMSNGIGSWPWHGATVDQVAGYECILYASGAQTRYLLSNGYGDDSGNDWGDDLGLMTSWHDLPGSRIAAHFGDHLVSGIVLDYPEPYVATVMAASLGDTDVSDDIGGQTGPKILPLDPLFTGIFFAYDTCPQPQHRYDRIEPSTGAVAGHGFEVAGVPGTTYPGSAASVVHDRLVGGDRKLDITFPFDLSHVETPVAKTAGVSAASVLLGEVLAQMAGGPPGGVPVAVPEIGSPGILDLEVSPNPFNPRVTVRFRVGRTADYAVEVFSLRGQKIAVLHDGLLAAGVSHAIAWDGRDARGQAVASGVYLLELRGDGIRQSTKIALLR